MNGISWRLQKDQAPRRSVLLSEAGSTQRRHPLSCPFFRLGLPTLDWSHPLDTGTLGPQETTRGKLMVSSKWTPPEGRRRGWETLYDLQPESCLATSHTLPLHLLAPVGTQPPLTREPSFLTPGRPPELGRRGWGSMAPSPLGRPGSLKDAHFPDPVLLPPAPNGKRSSSSASSFVAEEKAPGLIPAWLCHQHAG